MAGEYTVASEPERAREYTNKHGTNLTVWRFALEEARSQAADGRFELHRVKPPPKVGEKLAVERTQKGEFDDRPFTRLFLADTYQGGSSGSGGGSDNYDRRPDHPRVEARMIHTSSLSAAPDIIEQRLTIGVIQQPKNDEEYWALLSATVAALKDTYRVALVGIAGPATSPQVAAEVPADTEGLQPAATGPTDDVPF